MKDFRAKLYHFDFQKHVHSIGLISILIYVVTQSLESLGFVHICVYCQTIRSCIGLIGVLMVLPICPIMSRLLTIMFAYMGAHVAAAGIFMNIQRATYVTSFTVLATCALFILAAQVMIMMGFKIPRS